MKKLRRRHDETHADETWLIPYADLLTLLLALFIVLFASSQIDQKKFEEISKSLSSAFHGGASLFEPSTMIPISDLATDQSNVRTRQDNPLALDDQDLRVSDSLILTFRQETENLRKLKEQLDVYIDEHGLTTQLETKLNNQQLLITIRDNALFPSGSATVRANARNLAMNIGHMLVNYPQFEVVVAGHTDDRPIHTAEFPSNWDLSLKRAGNFMKILLDNEKLDPSRFSAVGYGEYRPIESNKTVEGRSANRRVEVSIVRTVKEADDEMIGVNEP